jgi:hypothetical protein
MEPLAKKLELIDGHVARALAAARLVLETAR